MSPPTTTPTSTQRPRAAADPAPAPPRDVAARDVATRTGWLVAFNALLLGWCAFRPAPPAVIVAVCDAAYVVGPLLAFLWCLPRPARSTPDPTDRARRGREGGAAAWLCLSLGPAAYAAGSVIWAYYEIVRHSPCPFPSWADAGFLAAYPFLLAGVLLMPRRPKSALLRGRALVDCLTVTAALATFSWFFVLGPIVAHGDGGSVGAWGLTLLGAGYPAFDVLLLFCALVLAHGDQEPGRRRAVRLLCAGLVSIAVVDTVFAYQTNHGTYATGYPIDVLWPLGYMLVGLGARELRLAGANGTSGELAKAAQESSAGARGASPLRTLLPYLLILPVGLLLLEVYRTHAGGVIAYGVYLGSAAVVALTLVRQALAAAENARLARDLRLACREMEAGHRRLEQAHATLLRSEELFRVASRCASDLIFEWDVATGRLQWYGDIDGQLGYGPGEFPRTLAAWQAAVHSDDAERVAAAVERLRRAGGTFCEEYRVRRRDGSWCHWIDRCVWLRGRGPRAGGRAVGTVTDVTDRRRAEQELRATEGRLRRQNAALVELARRQGTGPADLAAALAAVTEVAARTADVERCSVWLLSDDRSAIRCLDLFERTTNRHSAGAELAAGQFPAYFAAIQDDRTIVAHDAHTDSRTCEFSASYLAPLGISSMLDAPVRVGGVTVGVICHEHVGPRPRQWTMEEQHFADCMTNLVATAIAADQRRRAQEALHAEALAKEKLARERGALKDAVAAMEQVLGVVGHELRTPLAGLRAMSEFLLTDGAGEASEAEAFLCGIRDEVVRMSGTVNDLLEAARLNSGLARWNWSDVSLAEACAGAMGSVRPLVDPARVRLECAVEPEALTMRGDAEALRRLVLNLLSNAVRHTTDGHVLVTARPAAATTAAAAAAAAAATTAAPEGRAGEWVEIAIADTGTGIPPEIAARLGEAFALNSGIVGANYVSGAGLGLAICKGIIQAHGGSMHVDSAPGRGTTITVRLRRDLPAPAAGEGKAHVNRRTPTAAPAVS